MRRLSSALAGGRDISLLITDVDGTLLTPDKVLTRGAAAAVRQLADAGIGFTLISSRPPRGLERLVEQLDVRLPFGAFNGGSLVAPDLSLIEAHRLAPGAARQALDLLAAREVGAWVFARGDWRLRDPGGVNVPRERRTVGFEPTVVENFDDVIGCIDKIVGVSDDFARLERLEAEARILLGRKAAVILSQRAYLDVTHPKANKGDAVAAMCERIGVDISRTAVFGDMFNDVAMFERAGFSVAMGQAPETVKSRADAVTRANTNGGFASAVRRFILPGAAKA
jgi:Cof subfamily protein (haloacid dehalogenase superfamily)